MLQGCTEEPRVSYELVMTLKEMEVTCQDLQQKKVGQIFWIKPVMDGWGLLLISKGNEENIYELSLISHGHEKVYEARKIECSQP